MLAALRKDWRALEYVSDGKKNDEAIVLTAVRQYWRAPLGPRGECELVHTFARSHRGPLWPTVGRPAAGRPAACRPAVGRPAVGRLAAGRPAAGPLVDQALVDQPLVFQLETIVIRAQTLIFVPIPDLGGKRFPI